MNSATNLNNHNHLATYRVFCMQEMWKQDHFKAKSTTVPPGIPAGASVYCVPMQEFRINTRKLQDTGSFLDVFKTVLKIALLLVASMVVSVWAVQAIS